MRRRWQFPFKSHERSLQTSLTAPATDIPRPTGSGATRSSSSSSVEDSPAYLGLDHQTDKSEAPAKGPSQHGTCWLRIGTDLCDNNAINTCTRKFILASQAHSTSTSALDADRACVPPFTGNEMLIPTHKTEVLQRVSAEICFTSSKYICKYLPNSPRTKTEHEKL